MEVECIYVMRDNYAGDEVIINMLYTHPSYGLRPKKYVDVYHTNKTETSSSDAFIRRCYFMRLCKTVRYFSRGHGLMSLFHFQFVYVHALGA